MHRQVWPSYIFCTVAEFLAHLAKRPSELLPSLGIRRCPSVNFFKNLLHWTNLDQTCPQLSSGCLAVSNVPADQPTWLLLLKVEHRGIINKKNKLENPEKLCEGAIASKLRWNDTFVIAFRNYGSWHEPPSNMAATVI